LFEIGIIHVQSSSIMISNNRILANAASALLLVDVPAPAQGPGEP
jgi:hypothetical protein